jgi:Ca2+-binding RTX toxin-like protein
MSFKVGFGIGGAPTQWYLPGTDTTVLPGVPVGGTDPVGFAIQHTYIGGVPEGPLFDGRVLTATGAEEGGRPTLSFDVTGAWNSVKNGSFVGEGAAHVRMSGFVQADVTMTGGGASAVVIVGAKRGNVWTDQGDDTVSLEVQSNTARWSNEFRIATGQGDDTVFVRPLDRAAAVASGDATFAAVTGGVREFAQDDGMTRIFVDLGQGDDAFRAEGLSQDVVDGGSGDDTVSAGGGDDLLTGSEGDDLFVFGAGFGHDVVTDFGAHAAGRDRLRFEGMDADEVGAVLDAATEADGASILTLSGGDTVTLLGLKLDALQLDDLLG